MSINYTFISELNIFVRLLANIPNHNSYVYFEDICDNGSNNLYSVIDIQKKSDYVLLIIEKDTKKSNNPYTVKEILEEVENCQMDYPNLQISECDNPEKNNADSKFKILVNENYQEDEVASEKRCIFKIG